MIRRYLGPADNPKSGQVDDPFASTNALLPTALADLVTLQGNITTLQSTVTTVEGNLDIAEADYATVSQTVAYYDDYIDVDTADQVNVGMHQWFVNTTDDTLKIAKTDASLWGFSLSTTTTTTTTTTTSTTTTSTTTSTSTTTTTV